jgi:zinc protease
MKNFSFHRSQFDNGVVFLHHRTSAVPLVSVNLFLLVGKDQNPPDRPGLANFVARMLDEGTERWTHEEFSRRLEDMGAEMHTFCEREITGVCLTLQSRFLESGVECLAEMAQRAIFPAERIRRQRNLILEHLEATADDGELLGSQALNSRIYRGTSLAFPTLGTPESIQSVTSEELVHFHATRYGPKGCYVIVVGDVEASAAESVVAERFAGWTNPDQVRMRTGPFERQTSPERVELFLEREQVHVFLGHLGMDRTHPDFYAAQVMDAVLGGGNGFVSRIPQRLRDEMGLVYVAFADLSDSAGIYPGRFVAYAGTHPRRARLAHRILVEEVRRFREEGPAEAELEIAKSYLTGSFPLEFQSNLSVARLLLGMEVFGLGDDFPARYGELIGEVGCRDVRRVARAFLDPLNYTSVFVGKKAE